MFPVETLLEIKECIGYMRNEGVEVSVDKEW
jgi:hypothetical protein